MPDLHELEAGQNAEGSSGCRILDLRSGKELDVSKLDEHMREISAGEPGNEPRTDRVEQETVLMIRMKHYGVIPASTAREAARRAYDHATKEGLTVIASDPISIALSALPIKDEMPKEGA